MDLQFSLLNMITKFQQIKDISSDIASAISEGDIFIYSCSAQLISFEIESTSKEIKRAEHEYINMSPSLIALATPLDISD